MRNDLGDILRRMQRAGDSLPADEPSDGELLDHFLARREEAAFEMLVRRHAALVFGVCRRILRDPDATEDASQATFLLLLRKAQSIRKRSSVASWLYGVAHRVALRAKTRDSRRRQQERHAVRVVDDSPVLDTELGELRRVLDEEIARLPEKYQAPLILRYLEGKTNEEAAQQLSWPTGTVKGRLARARDMLRPRLGRRGLALPAGALGVLLARGPASAATPAAWASALAHAATAWLSGSAAEQAAAFPAGAVALAEGVTRDLFVTKLKAAALLTVLALCLGAGVGGYRLWAATPTATGDRPPILSAEVVMPEQPPHADKKEEGPKVVRFECHAGVVRGVAFSPDGKTLATAAYDQTVILWSVANGREVRRWPAHDAGIISAAFSADGTTLVTTGFDRSVRRWDVATGKELARCAGHPAITHTAAFSPDGERFASGGNDGLIRLWDNCLTREVRSFPADNASAVYALGFSADSTTLASGGHDGNAYLWCPRSGRLLRRFAGHTGDVVALAFSPDGRTLITGSQDHSIRLWEVATGAERLRLTGDNHKIGGVVFSPDGRTLASGGGDGIVHLWDSASGLELKKLAGHTMAVCGVAFAPDGKHLASGSEDQTALLWPVADVTARPAPLSAPLSASQLDALVADLGGADAAKAYHAIGALAARPAESVPLLAEQLRRPRAGAWTAARLVLLIADLDANEFKTRQEASAALQKAGWAAEPALRRALARPTSLEASRRLNQLLDELRPGTMPTADLVAVRAVEVLEHAGTAEARQLLSELAREDRPLRLAEEAAGALARLAVPRARP